MPIPLTDIPGIGKKRAQQLIEQHIHCLADLLHIIPQPCIPETDDWQGGDELRCVAQITDIKTAFIPRRGAMITIHGQRRNGEKIQARFFKALYLKKQFQIDQWYLFNGRCGLKNKFLLQSPSFHIVDSIENIDDFAVEYPNTLNGLSATALQTIARWAYTENLQCHDPLQKDDVHTYSNLLYCLHNLIDITPQDQRAEHWHQAREQIALREASSFMWQLRATHLQRLQAHARAYAWRDQDLIDGATLLPFDLSPAQTSALTTIFLGLKKSTPSLQLLQGDVGCGKTAVAFLAAWMALRNGLQVIYLAPTTILARQQYTQFQRYLNNHYPCTILDRSSSENQREDIQSFLRGTEPGIVVCTHALLHSTPYYPSVGLVIIDEEHKFGVQQRQGLISRCGHDTLESHVLMLSATPIPRSFMQCIYGHMDIARIQSSPADRGQIHSSLLKQKKLIAYTQALDNALDNGGACIIVAPYLKAEHQSIANAQSLHAQACALFPQHAIALLHSACSDQEKIQIHEDLCSGACRIVVSTSIIEVGIDLPLATCLLIFNSERFGLAQLHQLRGRLGRSHRDGTCVFLSPDPKKYPRLQILLSEKDGMNIAEVDMQQRGSGDILGTRQHGVPQFHCIELATDIQIMNQAQEIVATWKHAPRRQLFTA